MDTLDRLIPEHYFEKNNPLSFIQIDVDHSYQQHDHPFYEIIYISEGNGLLFVNDESVRIREGDLFFIPPGTPHMLRKTSDGASTLLQMMNCLFLPEILAGDENESSLIWDEEFQEIAGFFKRQTNWIGYHELNKEFAKIMYTMQQNQLNMPPGYRHKLYILLLDLLHTLYVQQQFKSPDAPVEVDDPVAFITSYIQTHYRDPLKLDKLCQWLSISPRHLQRLLKKTTGQTFIQLLQNARILRSCELLIETDWSIQTIAAEVGIYDMKYFYRIFKSRCLVTPSQFRKAHLDDNDHAPSTE